MIAATDAMHALHPRPADHSVVSWPDDPATNITSALFASSNVDSNNEPGQPGQFIYYMPLGHEGGKGENPRAWTHGWGDQWNTFWCCYGTAVESFSKLADSIYFWYTHPDDSGLYPIVFVNQFVSSTLRWKIDTDTDDTNNFEKENEEEQEEAVVLKQTADLYSSNTATSRVEFTIPSTGSRNFYVYWRLPSWLEHEEERKAEKDDGGSGNVGKRNFSKLAIRINGKSLDINTLSRLHGTQRSHSTAAKKENEKTSSSLFPEASSSSSLLLQRLPLLDSFNPPTFGKDASDYIILGPEWNDGDVLEVDMPMKITTEDLNDSRPEKQNLKAIIMGPFQMAGLTVNGDREIDIDPEDIEDAVRLLENSQGVKSGPYPKGARLLSGKTKKYIIAPIGQLIDEKYTAYFDFVAVGPSGAGVASE